MDDAELVQAKQERNSASKRAADWEAACYRIDSDNARLRAELETVREAARACADSVVTTMGVFDDGEEEEMLIVPPNTLEALRLALSNKGGGDDG